jgi:hypothetical protein
MVFKCDCIVRRRLSDVHVVFNIYNLNVTVPFKKNVGICAACLVNCSLVGIDVSTLFTTLMP